MYIPILYVIIIWQHMVLVLKIPSTYMEVTERKQMKAIHTHHKITNSAKIEAMHTIRLQVQQNLNTQSQLNTLFWI